MVLNENIKKFRREAGMTQKTLASKSGLSFSMISKLESGEQSNPSFETIRKIADVLKINPGNLISITPTIEEQIDEYIEYKRGLSKNTNQSALKYKNGAAEQEGPYNDLNFKKKLQAINNIPMPSDEGHYEYMKSLEHRPEMEKLFTVLQHATKDEINQVTRLIETFRRI